MMDSHRHFIARRTAASRAGRCALTPARAAVTRAYAHRIDASRGIWSPADRVKEPPMTAPSLRAYLKQYAAGHISRDDMLATVANWPLEEREWDLAHTLPDHQDNTAEVISGAVLNDQITEEDYREIWRRRRQIG